MFIFKMNFSDMVNLALQLANCTVAPDTCPNSNITFWVYNMGNLQTGTRITFDSVRKKHFILDRPLVVLIHGFSTNRNDPLNTNNRQVLIKQAKVNVISVDYGTLVPFPCYPQAVASIIPIGKCVGKFLDKLIQLKIFTTKDIHIIAFSLGSHIAGVASSTMENGRVARITGLDPASPIVSLLPDPYNLNENDANFVDIYHTDILTRGIQNQIGHVDVYVNGGAKQPGCETAADPGDCNHERATKIYAESILTNTGFWATRCQVKYSLLGQVSCVPVSGSSSSIRVGYRIRKTNRGTYYLKTNSAPPYAQGK